MKKIAQILVFMSCCILLIGCGSKDFKNQPWMPSKTKGKHGHSNSGHKKSVYIHRDYSNY